MICATMPLELTYISRLSDFALHFEDCLMEERHARGVEGVGGVGSRQSLHNILYFGLCELRLAVP